MTRCFALLTLTMWLLAAGPVAAVTQLPDDAIVLRPDDEPGRHAEIRQRVAQALAALAKGDADAAWNALPRESDVVAFERTAAALIDALMPRPATAATGQMLLRLGQTRVRVFVRHEETAADWFLPVFDIPGKAESARRVMQATARRDALLAALGTEGVKAIARHREDAPGVLVDVLLIASPEQVEAIAAHALKSRLQLSSPAWAGLAHRLPSRDVLDAALLHAEPVDLLPLFEVVSRHADTDVAFDWLQQAAQHTEYATLAVMSLGKLAPRSPAAEAALLKHLGRSDTGAAAAAALAQWNVPDRVSRIAAIGAKAATPQQLRDVALALRLEGSDAAADALLALAHDPRLPSSVARELQR